MNTNLCLMEHLQKHWCVVYLLVSWQIRYIPAKNCMKSARSLHLNFKHYDGAQVEVDFCVVTVSYWSLTFRKNIVPSTSVVTNSCKNSAGCGSIRLGLLEGSGIVCEMWMTSMMPQMNSLFRFLLKWGMTWTEKIEPFQTGIGQLQIWGTFLFAWLQYLIFIKII